MKMLSAEEMMELRDDLARSDISDKRKDDLIHYLDAIAISFIDQSRGKSAVQLSLSARANYAFNGVEPYANLPRSEISEPVDLNDEGAFNTKGPTRQLAP